MSVYIWTTWWRCRVVLGGQLHIKATWLCLQISSFRESKSDDRRFYLFTATKTLHLRTNTNKERVAWIHALISTRSLFSLRPLNDNIPLLTRDISVSTERLKERLLEDGIDEGLVKDCEQIMLLEFSEIQGQYKVLFEERSNLLDTLRQLEVIFISSFLLLKSCLIIRSCVCKFRLVIFLLFLIRIIWTIIHVAWLDADILNIHTVCFSNSSLNMCSFTFLEGHIHFLISFYFVLWN